MDIFIYTQIQQPVDIMLSHDWPLHAVHAGNIEQLLRWYVQQVCLFSFVYSDDMTWLRYTFLYYCINKITMAIYCTSSSLSAKSPYDSRNRCLFIYYRKSDFREEIQQNQLGSPAAQEVLTHIKPTYWFSAHLHCKYPAVIKHKVTIAQPQQLLWKHVLVFGSLAISNVVGICCYF